MPALSVFAGLFFELACRMFPLVLAVVSAGACDRLAVEFDKASQVFMSSAGSVSTPSVSTLPSATGLRSACNWLSALDSVPESEAEAWAVADSETGAAGISTGISVGSPSSCIYTTSSSKSFILSMNTMYGKPRKPVMSTRST